MTSGGGMPELGSKISLISKADIRYEGRLYTVDPQECTIALSNVRSFGTEDRETQFQIAPQSQIYDYILFRGSDIKDIRVVNNNLPHPNDPAIMQVHLPNGQHLMPQFPMPHMNAPHGAAINASGFGQPFGGALGNIAAIGTQAGGAGGNVGAGNVPPTSLAPGSGASGSAFILGAQQQQQQQTSQQLQQQKTQHQQPNKSELNVLLIGKNEENELAQNTDRDNKHHQQPPTILAELLPMQQQQAQAKQQQNEEKCTESLLLPGILDEAKKKVSVFDYLKMDSRSTTPGSHTSRKSSPTMGHQKHRGGGGGEHQPRQQQMQNNNIGHIGGGAGAAGVGKSRDAGYKRTRNNFPQQGLTQQHPQFHYQFNNQHQHRGPNNQQHPQQGQQQQRRGGNNAYNNLGMNMHNYRIGYNGQFEQSRGGGNNGMNRSFRMYRDGPQNNQMMNMRHHGGNGFGRGRMSNQGYGPMGGIGPIGGGPQGNQNKPRNNKNTIKFEQDFDFEQANNKFEELRSQLTKLKLGEEPKATEQINGETDKKDDSGNETGAGEHEHEDEEITVGYDKTKSFFDNISCEAAQDRSKNKKNDWRQERKLNSETFGVSSTRRDMNFRGRRVFGRGPNMNYNNGGGYNNRGYIQRGNNNRNNRPGNNRPGSNRMNAGMGAIVQHSDNIEENATLNGNNNDDAAVNLKTQQTQTAGTPNSAVTKTKPLENQAQQQAAAVVAGQ